MDQYGGITTRRPLSDPAWRDETLKAGPAITPVPIQRMTLYFYIQIKSIKKYDLFQFIAIYRRFGAEIQFSALAGVC
jgi:hypothetical protein